MTTALPRSRPGRLLAALFGLGALAVAATFYGTSAAGAASTAPSFTNPTQITNTWLPISSIKRAEMLGVKEGVSVRSVRTLLRGTKTFQVNGKAVNAAIVEDRAWENGNLHEVALDYFAQADDGTVHYLGEDVDIYDPTGTTVVSHEGAFLYGVDTKTLGVAMPANPQPGNRFTFEKIPGVGSETNRVVSVTATVAVPYGTFTNSALEIDGFLSPGGERETKWYARGVGVIKEADATGATELVSLK